MKTKPTARIKEFDTVKIFREIKEQISLELVGKTPEQIKAWIKAHRRPEPWCAVQPV